MARWATFAITKVRYNKAGTRILQVVRRRDLGDRLGKPVIRTRQQIVIAIRKRYTYVTTYKEKDGWVRGDKVIRYLLDGEYFIRTDGNKKKSDNLGKLPRF